MSFSNMYEKLIHYRAVHNVWTYFHVWLQALKLDSFSKVTHLSPVGSLSIMFVNEVYGSNLGIYLICVCNLVANIAGGKEAEGVWEQGVEENIWT